MKLAAPTKDDLFRRFTLFAVLLLTCGGTVGADEFLLTTIFGETKQVAIDSIQDDKVVVGKALLAFDGLRELRRESPPDPIKVGAMVVHLVGGGKLHATNVSSDDENCTIKGHGLFEEPLKLPIDYVMHVVLQPALMTSELRAKLQESRDEDRIFLSVDGNVEQIDGLVESISNDDVAFSWNDSTRKLPREKLVAIGIASSGIKPAGNCKVLYANGTAIFGQVQSLDSDNLSFVFAEKQEWKLRWQDVMAIEIDSDRVTYLSDLKPVSVEHRPIVTSQRSWKKDRNVNGGPLQLGPRVYTKGLGVASHSTLRYQLNGEFETFCATIGIDRDTEGRGDCVFVVQADGKELARQSMNGTDEPKRLNIGVESARELQLIVEYGNDLDLGDHANWCDACLLRE